MRHTKQRIATLFLVAIVVASLIPLFSSSTPVSADAIVSLDS